MNTEGELSLRAMVTRQQVYRMTDFPDRMSAECELPRLQREYGDRLIEHQVIRNQCKRGPVTFTLRYVIRVTNEERV